MKRIKDIESMDPEALETAALEEKASVPEGLETRICEVLAAQAEGDRSGTRGILRIRTLIIPVAVAAALAAVVLLPLTGRLRDTFDDPYLAYAEVESAFRQISDKMAMGVDLAGEARTTAETPFRVIRKINEQ